MIKAINLAKKFGNVVAVEHVSFTANRGEIYGLLGPNGAGKTTTLRMLYGLVSPTSGKIFYDQHPLQENIQTIQQQLGALPDGGSLYARLTAKENIEYFGRLHGMDKHRIRKQVDEFTERLSMGNIINRKTQGFSQGERMKVSLSRALIHNPDFILLDEPTNGLDVLTTRAVRNLLLELKQQGKCIIFSSHLMHEVSNLCDKVGIIANGSLVKEGTINDVLQAAAQTNLEDAFVHFAYNGHSEKDASLQ